MSSRFLPCFLGLLDNCLHSVPLPSSKSSPDLFSKHQPIDSFLNVPQIPGLSQSSSPLKPASPLMFPRLRHKTVICPLGQPRMLGRVISSWSAQPLLPLIQSPDRSGICQQLYSLRFRREPCVPMVAPSLSSLPPGLGPPHQTGHPVTQGSSRDDSCSCHDQHNSTTASPCLRPYSEPLQILGPS